MTIKHKNLAAGKWSQLSLIEQMANIGSEINRAILWQKKDKKLYLNAINRAFELLNLTIADSRWQKRLKELTRVRELMHSAVLEEQEYKTSLQDLNKYFFHFALATRINK